MKVYAVIKESEEFYGYHSEVTNIFNDKDKALEYVSQKEKEQKQQCEECYECDVYWQDDNDKYGNVIKKCNPNCKRFSVSSEGYMNCFICDEFHTIYEMQEIELE